MNSDGSKGGDTVHNVDTPRNSGDSRRLITTGRLKVAGLIGIAVAVIIVVIGMFIRASDNSSVAKWTREQTIPSVSVVNPSSAGTGGTILLPGRVEAFYRAPIYARVSGYLKAWYTDIGARVKAGQVLAAIETPDLDQQLQQAKAEVATARANESLAESTARRWQLMLQADSVSKQAEDEKAGDLAAKRTITAAAMANVQRLQALEAFKQIVAPFDGIVTARDTDVGALINAGGGTGPQLFTVSDIHQLRVYVSVPQSEAALIRAGMSAELTVPEHPDRTYTATVDSTSGAVNVESGALLVELLLTDPSGSVMPGDYANVRLDLPEEANVVRIPASTLIFRSGGLQVASVDANHRVSMHTITVKRDLGSWIEVASGIKSQDSIIDNPPDDIGEGDQVQVIPAESNVVKPDLEKSPEPTHESG